MILRGNWQKINGLRRHETGLLPGAIADFRQWEWQCRLLLKMELEHQSICGLCILSQGRLRTMGDRGEGNKIIWIVSLWCLDRMCTVCLVMWAKSLPSSTVTFLGEGRSTMGMPGWSYYDFDKTIVSTWVHQSDQRHRVLVPEKQGSYLKAMWGGGFRSGREAHQRPPFF